MTIIKFLGGDERFELITTNGSGIRTKDVYNGKVVTKKIVRVSGIYPSYTIHFYDGSAFSLSNEDQILVLRLKEGAEE